ncbi:Deoxyribose-phosphate aldolase [Candidatus Methanobinarius endosymbioticus]|uniref:Deoxyribose-phosphate aldolase n=1 Tax=Candidatus Methanobinarius endosymbioticus TaxID=2006182 RepID=A0A366MDX8_9EURY|nr:Deoxyribose-phosphate aldolase [Candidatus Methanobinarius endosymbioticus]
MMKVNSSEELASKIEYTNLKNTAKKEDIEYLAKKAIDYGFYSIVVSPYYVEYAKELLKDTDIKVVTVVGFPLGYNASKAKKKESKIAIKSGADEIDMVINFQAFKAGDYDTVSKELKKIREVTEGKILKVIVEAELLSDEELIEMTDLVAESGAEYVKTSTGMSGQSPKASHLVLIRKNAPKLKVKASGGINDYKTTIRLISAGADKIGTSSGDLIMEEYERNYEKQLMDGPKGFMS